MNIFPPLLDLLLPLVDMHTKTLSELTTFLPGRTTTSYIINYQKYLFVIKEKNPVNFVISPYNNIIKKVI